MKKGSGNIVYNDVVTAECNNCILAVSRLNSKASLLFAGQNDYDDYCSYDSFVASDTHFYKVDFQRLSSPLFEFETTVSYLCQGLSSFLLAFRHLCHTHF